MNISCHSILMPLFAGFLYYYFDVRLVFLNIFFLCDFLCASLDQCNILGLWAGKKSSLICNLNLQNLLVLAAKCGKLFIFLWQNLGFEMAIFRDARLMCWAFFCEILTFLEN